MEKIVLDIVLYNDIPQFDVSENNIYLSVSNLDELKYYMDNLLIEFQNMSESLLYFIDKDSYEEMCDKIKNRDYELNELSIYKDFENIDDFSFIFEKCKKINLVNMDVDEIISFVKKDLLTEDMLITTKYNASEYVKTNELKDVINYLNLIKLYVKGFDLSPLETCIFVYDLLREKEYKYSLFDLDKEYDNEKCNNSFEKYHESENISDVDLEDFDLVDSNVNDEIINGNSLSRSLFKVYNSDAIVCQGFVKMYQAILEMLDIKVEEIMYNSYNGSSHSSSIVYINDLKYGLNVAVEVDPTWGRVFDKNGEYNYKKTLYNYSNFGLSINDAFNSKKHDYLRPSNSPSTVYKIINQCNRIKQFTDLQVPSCIYDSCVKNFIKYVHEYEKNIESNLFDNEIAYLTEMYISNKIYENMQEIEKVFDDIINIIKSQEIDTFSFSDALFHVKMIEQAIDSEKYPYSEEMYLKAVKSCKSNTFYNLFEAPLIAKNKEKRELENARMRLISSLRKLSGNQQIIDNPIVYKKKRV